MEVVIWCMVLGWVQVEKQELGIYRKQKKLENNKIARVAL